jgi:nucleoside phosphorylase
MSCPCNTAYAAGAAAGAAAGSADTYCFFLMHAADTQPITLYVATYAIGVVSAAEATRWLCKEMHHSQPLLLHMTVR